jgi:predicted ester cyclase
MVRMDDLRDFYRRYLQRCNEHEFARLGEFVHEDVRINDGAGGLGKYIGDLDDAVALAPDYFWDLQHLLVDGNWLSAHSIDRGTTTSGRTFTVPEFTIYRIEDGRIAEVWGDFDLTRLG